MLDWCSNIYSCWLQQDGWEVSWMNEQRPVTHTNLLYIPFCISTHAHVWRADSYLYSQCSKNEKKWKTLSLEKDKSCQMLQATFRRCVSSWCFKPESIFEGKHFAMLCLKTFPFPYIDFCVALRINKTRAAVSVIVCVACPCRLSDYKTTSKCLFCASRFHTVFVVLHVKQTCF